VDSTLTADWRSRLHLTLARHGMALLARLPLAGNHVLGSLLGEIAWLSRSRLRRVSEINLDLCRPTASAEERRELVRRSLRETGKTLTETAWLWHRPRDYIAGHLVEVHGAELLDAATARGQGLVIATPHIGSWELCNLAISTHATITYLYRPPRTLALEPLLIDWRRNLGGKPARLDSGGIRQVLGELRAGRTVGILPDQEPDATSGVFAPFFGIPALTMTLLARLASRPGTTVLFLVAERLPRGRGWRAHFVAPEPGISNADKVEAAAAINRTAERCIELCPTQYLWSYKRFRAMPGGERRSYR